MPTVVVGTLGAGNVTFAIPAGTWESVTITASYSFAFGGAGNHIQVGNTPGPNQAGVGPFTDTFAMLPTDLVSIADAAGQSITLLTTGSVGVITITAVSLNLTAHAYRFGKRWSGDGYLGLLGLATVDDDAALYTTLHRAALANIGAGTVGWEAAVQVEPFASECNFAFMHSGRAYLSYALEGAAVGLLGSYQRTNQVFGASPVGNWSAGVVSPSNLGLHFKNSSPSAAGSHLHRGNKVLVLARRTGGLSKLDWSTTPDALGACFEDDFLIALWQNPSGAYIFPYPASNISGVFNINETIYLCTGTTPAVLALRVASPELPNEFGATPGSSGIACTDTLIVADTYSNLVQADAGVLMALVWTEQRTDIVYGSANRGAYALHSAGGVPDTQQIDFALPAGGAWIAAQIHSNYSTLTNPLLTIIQPPSGSLGSPTDGPVNFVTTIPPGSYGPYTAADVIITYVVRNAVGLKLRMNNTTAPIPRSGTGTFTLDLALSGPDVANINAAVGLVDGYTLGLSAGAGTYDFLTITKLQLKFFEANSDPADALAMLTHGTANGQTRLLSNTTTNIGEDGSKYWYADVGHGTGAQLADINAAAGATYSLDATLSKGNLRQLYLNGDYTRLLLTGPTTRGFYVIRSRDRGFTWEMLPNTIAGLSHLSGWNGVRKDAVWAGVRYGSPSLCVLGGVVYAVWVEGNAPHFLATQDHGETWT